MSFVISSYIPFPPLSWWAAVLDGSTVCWDDREPFRKITYRNRYYISGGNGVITMSIPLADGGRGQRTAMGDVRIDPRDQWQLRQWRTLVSAYARSPYFEHYEPELKILFDKPFEKLSDFSLASVHWLKSHIGLDIKEELYSSDLEIRPHNIDLRRMTPASLKHISGFPAYHQVFHDRFGFIPNLSVLDLLFAEGPYTKKWLQENSPAIKEKI